jgi:tRNA modification GTPase
MVPDEARPTLRLSGKTGAGLDTLRAMLREHAGLGASSEGLFLARARHLEALQQARAHLAAARQQLADGTGAELAAEELRLAQAALGRITGEVTSDALLGEIFARFCIGK